MRIHSTEIECINALNVARRRTHASERERQNTKNSIVRKSQIRLKLWSIAPDHINQPRKKEKAFLFVAVVVHPVFVACELKPIFCLYRNSERKQQLSGLN